MGHEFSGTIVETESETACSPALKVGMRVTVDPMVYDGTCLQCRMGRQHLCEHRNPIGAGRPGAFARYVAVPAHMVFVLPESLDLRTCALAEPRACAIRAASLMGDVRGADVLIVGAGAIGLLAVQALSAQGVGRVFVSDTNTGRLANATALGATTLNPLATDVVTLVLDATDGRGVAVSLDVVGKAVTRAQCVAGAWC